MDENCFSRKEWNEIGKKLKPTQTISENNDVDAKV